MKPTRVLQLLGIVLLSLVSLATVNAQEWSPLNTQPNFAAGHMQLLTDGTVLVQQVSTGNWYQIIPNTSGVLGGLNDFSYTTGSFNLLPQMPSGYGPRFYASAVLPDGRFLVEGGEYNFGVNTDTNLGAIYDPVGQFWHSVQAPSGWSQIGDATSVVLANGTFMMGQATIFSTGSTRAQALFDATHLTWNVFNNNSTSSGKTDPNAEEGWTLLPNKKVLTVDTQAPFNLPFNSEIFNPGSTASKGTWSSAGSTQVLLPTNGGNPNIVPEMGPSILRPDGTVFSAGATGSTAIYNTHSTATNKWSAGPSFPANFFPFDAPAAILPSGNVLVMASNNFAAPSQFFEFDGTNLSPTAVLPRQGSEPAFVGSMLVLPTGQIMFTDESQDVEVFTSSDPFNPAWAPTISSSPGTVMIGGTSYSVSGTQFNGLTQGAMYGDDAQMATNFPLVLITNNATGDAVFARTHNHSTMAVATGTATVSTKFDVPFSAETGPSTLQVIANGIPSSPVNVNVVSGPFPVDLSGNFNVTGMYWDTSTFSASGSLDGIGHSYSENLLGSLVSWNNIPLFLGPPDPDSSLPNAIQPNGDFVDLGAFGGFSQLRMLATSVDGNSPGQTFTLNYTDGTTASFTQSFSNWTAAQNYSGETKVVTMPYRDKGDGTKSTGTTYLYGYTFHLDSTKSLNFMILPVAKNLRILAMTVAP